MRQYFNPENTQNDYSGPVATPHKILTCHEKAVRALVVRMFLHA